MGKFVGYHSAMRLAPILLSLLIGLSVLPRGFAQGFPENLPSTLPDLGDASSATLSPQMEKRIGEEAMRQIRAREPSYVDDPEIAEYLNVLGKKLSAASSGMHQDFEFFLIKDDSINAFAMPGGFIGVHSGLLLAAQTESELAGVLAHEISHVTQHHIARLLSKQSQLSAISLAGLLVAILASRSAAGPAVAMASQAGAVGAQLAYTRDFEREADRIGFQVLQQAGFEGNGMVSFFERLQRATRVHENNAPAYLQSHPLTLERISDIQNRVQGAPYKQRVDSPEFYLVRAKLRAENGTPREARAYFESELAEKRYTSEVAARYGLVTTLVRNREFKRAEAELQGLRALAGQQPMVDLLAARMKTESGDLAGAGDLLKAALVRLPNYRPFNYAYVQLLQRAGRHQEALDRLVDLVRSYPRESRFYSMQAQSYSATGKQMLSHRAQGEFYFVQGSLAAAAEQLELGRRAGDGDFYQMSSLEARLREMRTSLEDEIKRR